MVLRGVVFGPLGKPTCFPNRPHSTFSVCATAVIEVSTTYMGTEENPQLICDCYTEDKGWEDPIPHVFSIMGSIADSELVLL